MNQTTESEYSVSWVVLGRSSRRQFGFLSINEEYENFFF